MLSPLRIAEQIVSIPVPRGRVQGFLPEQSTTAQTVEQIVDISSLGGLGQGSASSAGAADEDFTGGVSHFSPRKKVRSAGQEVSAQLGGHVSSSTLSAHQVARAGEPVDSDGSDVWVLICLPDISKSYYWNRRTNSAAWDPLAGVEVVWVGETNGRGSVWHWNQVTGLTTDELPPVPPG